LQANFENQDITCKVKGGKNQALSSAAGKLDSTCTTAPPLALVDEPVVDLRGVQARLRAQRLLVILGVVTQVDPFESKL
jgi:hypothetical protein